MEAISLCFTKIVMFYICIYVLTYKCEKLGISSLIWLQNIVLRDCAASHGKQLPMNNMFHMRTAYLCFANVVFCSIKKAFNKHP